MLDVSCFCWNGPPLLPQVSDMRLSSSCLSWTSTTSWSWPGGSTTCCSVFSRSSPGLSASSRGTQMPVWRTPSAKTRPCGWRSTPPTLPPLLQNFGSELLLATCTRRNRLMYTNTALCARVCHLQTERSDHFHWDWWHRAPEVGPGPVSPGCVGHLLLLHLERSQVNWEGEQPVNYSRPNAIWPWIFTCFG